MARKKHPDAGLPPPDTYQKPPQSEWVGPWQIRARWRKKGMPSVSQVFETWEEAWSWYEAKADEFRQRGTISDKRESERTTLAEAMDMWLGSSEAQGKRGIEQIRKRVSRLKTEPFADYFLSSVTLVDMQRWIDRREKEGKAPTTITNELSVISNTFQYVNRQPGFEGLGNPARGVRKPRSRPGRDVRLTDEDEARLIETIQNRRVRSTHWLRPMVELAILSGMRQGELRALTWRNVHLEEAWAHIPESKDIKGSRPRDVPLLPEAVKVLKDWRDQGVQSWQSLVFHDVTDQAVSKAFAAAAEAAGLPHLTFHDLRHVAVTRLSKVTKDALELSKFSGHKTLNVLQVYYNPDASDLARMAAEVIEKQNRSVDTIIAEIDDLEIVTAIRDRAKATGERIDTLIMSLLRAAFVSPEKY
jgi:integrase